MLYKEFWFHGSPSPRCAGGKGRDVSGRSMRGGSGRFHGSPYAKEFGSMALLLPGSLVAKVEM